MSSPIDLTPSAIAAKLLPEDAEPRIRAVAEAMAERALREVRDCQTAAGTMLLTERLMVQAAEALLRQNDVRMGRLAKIFELANDDSLCKCCYEPLGDLPTTEVAIDDGCPDHETWHLSCAREHAEPNP